MATVPTHGQGFDVNGIDLKSVLSSQIVDDVEIVPSPEFVRKLPTQAPFFPLTP